MRVLVVEDHADFADVIRETLERDGQQVKVAVSAEQGEQLAHLEDFEVLILGCCSKGRTPGSSWADGCVSQGSVCRPCT